MAYYKRSADANISIFNDSLFSMGEKCKEI